ncbi:hypothetical protein ACFXDE_01690 [Kitasatospora sp. NPDC059408]|uniref:hypothetical protein n=1 Tax=Kitasatospora sp. NPDC059408 TaxID=3346823 RepID=UPI00368BEABD
MFTLRFQTSGHHWHRTGLTRADVARMIEIAQRRGGTSIQVTNLYGTAVTHLFVTGA